MCAVDRYRYHRTRVPFVNISSLCGCICAAERWIRLRAVFIEVQKRTTAPGWAQTGKYSTYCGHSCA